VDGWFGSAATARLRQCEWNCADDQKQKQVERASNKVRFDGGINLLFHGAVLVRILIFTNTRLHFESGTLLPRRAKQSQDFPSRRTR
jgi:hypothetical protein